MRFLTVAILLMSGFTAPRLLAEADTMAVSQYEWQPFKGASYYRGKFDAQARPVVFQTKGMAVRLPSKLAVAVSAYGRDDKVLGQVNVRETPISGGLTAPKAKKNDVESYLADIDQLLEAQGAFRVKDGVDWVQPPSAPPEFNWTASVWFGLGSETLKLKGGVADYSGQSLTGDTLLAFRWDQKGGMYQVQDSPWAAEVELDFHNHQASVTTENTLDGTSETKTEKQYRARFHGVALYKLASVTTTDTPKGWELEGGIGGLRMPVFRLRDQSTGRTEFGDAQLIGPRIGVRYLDTYSRGNHWEARAASIPLASGAGHKGQATDLKFVWIYDWMAETQFLGAGAFHLESVTGTIDCPAVSDCSSSSSSRSQQVIFSVGAQHQF